jgi:ubiquinone/menaquinone biosynthesis C-methylase UbiE
MSATVRDLFDAMAPAYHRLEPWYEHLYAVLHDVMSAELGAPAVPGGRALDAGCGTGFQTTVLAERGWRAHGVDIASSLLLLARDRVPRATFARADIRALPYAAASFDAAVCCGSTLSFVENPGRALAELGRVLRPGGVLFLECEHRPSLDLGWALASALTGNALGYDLSLRQAWRALVARGSVRVAYPGYGALQLFTRRHLHMMLESAGLAPRREWGVHSITNALPSTLLHRDRLPRPLAALYRALCRLDTALAPTRAGRALGNSLVILAERAQSSA